MPALIFDLDGTLVDSAPGIHAAVNAMLHAEGLAPLDLPTVTSFIGHGLARLVERVMKVRGIDDAEHARLHDAVLSHYTSKPAYLSTLYPDVRQVLDRFRSQAMPMGVCTNKPEAAALKDIEALGLRDVFDIVIGGDSLAERKPHPLPLQAVVAALGDMPALYVGDSEVDGETAQRAGVDFALFTEGYRKVGVNEIAHRFAFSRFRELPVIAARCFENGGRGT